LLELGSGPGNLWRENLDRIPAGWQILLSDLSPGMIEVARKSLAAPKSAPAVVEDAPPEMSDVLAAVIEAYVAAGSGFAGVRAAFVAARKARAADQRARAGVCPDPAGADSSAGPLFSFTVHDAQDLSYPDGAFDAVVANHMLYHVADKQRVLAEIRRVLAPGGRFYAATNGTDHMRELRELSRRVQPEAERQVGRVGASFTLENGAQQLWPWFPNLTCVRQENGLRVPEIEPVLAYLASTQALSAEAMDACAALLEQELSERGAIYIQKDSGMFVGIRD
jgi:SAM-dependent methyltransferase